MRCGRQIGEMLRTHGMRDAAKVEARVAELLTSVGLPDHARIADSTLINCRAGNASAS